MNEAKAATGAPRRVLVTGAASGIGRATAELLRSLGTEVVAADLSAEGLAELSGANLEVVAGDVSNPEDRARMLEAAADLDGLVNAAGVNRLAAIEEISDEVWDPILTVNLKAAFYLARDAGAQMGRGGSIVNISSLAARYGANTELLCYAASKAAVLAVTRGLAHAFGPRGVRVNAVLPGLIDTPMQDIVLERLSEIREIPKAQLEEARTAGVPLESRAGTAGECAATIAFLLSPAASYITGQSIMVDGGIAMP